MKKDVLKVNLIKILPERSKIHIENNELNNLFYIVKNKSNTLANLSKELSINPKNLSRYKTGKRAMPLNIFLRIITLTEIDINKLQNKIKIKIYNTGKPLQIGPSLEINKDWVYIAELLRGDGHINKRMWYIQFINKDRCLIEFVNNFFLGLGVPIKQIDLRQRRGIYFLTIRSMLLVHIFKELFNLQPGARGDVNIPNLIKNNQTFSTAAIAGFFDAEGNISAGSKKYPHGRCIRMSTTSLEYLKDIRRMLAKLNISSKLYSEDRHKFRNIHRLVISHKTSIQNFKENITILQSKRAKLLNILLNSYTDKIAEGSLRKPLLKALYTGSETRSKLATSLNISKKQVGNQLWWLKSKKMISVHEKIYSNKGSYFKYKITKKGEQFLLL
jgi:intein/homing endonuclease